MGQKASTAPNNHVNLRRCEEPGERRSARDGGEPTRRRPEKDRQQEGRAVRRDARPDAGQAAARPAPHQERRRNQDLVEHWWKQQRTGPPGGEREGDGERAEKRAADPVGCRAASSHGKNRCDGLTASSYLPALRWTPLLHERDRASGRARSRAKRPVVAKVEKYPVTCVCFPLR